MTEEGQAKYPKETGGILVGWLEGSIIHIEVAVGPGPKAINKRNSFIRDGDYSQRQLDGIVVETAGQWDYIGEWHSHPREMGPSPKDIKSLIKVQTSPAYNILHPILGLLINQKGNWVYRCYIFLQNNRLIEITKVELLTE